MMTKPTNNRTIAIDGSVIDSIIVNGDNNRFFVGQPGSLRDAYINPFPVFERVALEYFTGREWLVTEIDTFLHSHDRGYFILEAQAGLGKTTFMAWLVKERGYIHHFCELRPGAEGIGQAIKNLSVQLLLLGEGSESPLWESYLPNAALRPDYLEYLLQKASQNRQDNQKIVLVIDALDEAGTPYNRNVLGLPKTLPEGVYILASQRPGAVRPYADETTTPRVIYHLRAIQQDNQDYHYFAKHWNRNPVTLISKTGDYI